MGCNCQSTGSVGATAADPCRRVNYTLGMILGVDDFVQDQIYHDAHRQAVTRLGLGYGTVQGLQVGLDLKSKPAQVKVATGAAFAPSGRIVRLESDQCCEIPTWFSANPLEKWLKDNKVKDEAMIVAKDKSKPTELWAKAWVVLSFREALCADVPIPGEACRTDDKLMAPSRIEDGWDLEITWNRPGQIEEDALKDFFRWICRIPFQVDRTSLDFDETTLLTAVRDAAKERLAHPEAGVGDPPDYMDFGAKPFDPPPFLFKGNLLRSVLRLWVTEFRPVWCARYGWAPATTDADEILLSGIWIPVKGSTATRWDVDPKNSFELDQVHRPVLLSVAALQSLVERLPYEILDSLPELKGDVTGKIQASKVVALRNRPILDTLPLVGDVLGMNGTGEWGPVHVEGDIKGPMGTNKVVALLGSALVDAPPAPLVGQVLSRDADGKWTASAVAGDVTGPVGQNRIAKLMGSELLDPQPAAAPGQVPTRDADGKWTVSAVAGDVTGPVGQNKIARFMGSDLLDPQPAAAPGQVPTRDADGKWTVSAVAGDVTGPVGQNKIAKLLGTDLVSAAPAAAPGQFLVRGTDSKWTPAPLSGDVGIAPATAAATVKGIGGFPLKGTAGDGQVLRFDGAAKSWVPADLSVPVPARNPVERSGSRVSMVAAGSLLVTVTATDVKIEPDGLYSCDVATVTKVDAVTIRIDIKPTGEVLKKPTSYVQFTPLWLKDGFMDYRVLLDRVVGDPAVTAVVVLGSKVDKARLEFQFQVFETEGTVVP